VSVQARMLLLSASLLSDHNSDSGVVAEAIIVLAQPRPVYTGEGTKRVTPPPPKKKKNLDRE